MPLKFIDLFAGLGGFHLAFDRLGCECVFASEINSDLRQLYERNYGMPCAGDITEIDIKKDIPTHDILCAGFPCQPFSKAGMQGGFDDEQGRGNLFYKIMDILREHTPEYVFLENVPNLKSHDGGNTYKVISEQLNTLYDIADDIISPHHFGIPQHRTRIYIVGRLKSLGGLHNFHFPSHEGKTDSNIESILIPEDEDYMSIRPTSRRHIAAWQHFLNILAENNVPIPTFPIWAMEFGATYDYKGRAPYFQTRKQLEGKRGNFGLSIPNKKSTVQEVYDFIMDDIDAAFAINNFAAPTSNRMRVNSAFAYAVKAKVLMSLRDYEGAYQAASSSLAIENTVDDYNTMLVNTGSSFSFSRPDMSSKEDLFFTTYAYLLWVGLPPELIESFESGNVFYNHVDMLNNGGLSYYSSEVVDVVFDRDTYMTTSGGLSTVDMYLVQVECLIRKNDIIGAMDIINFIRRHRLATEAYLLTIAANPEAAVIDPSDFYAPLSAANKTEAMTYFKRLTRNEQWYSPKRYISLKRWNTEDEWRETLTKHVEVKVGENIENFNFSLAPNSPLWIFPFPSKSTGLNANLTQNY